MALFAVAALVSETEAGRLRRQLELSDHQGEVERCDHHVVVYQGSDSVALRDNYHQAQQVAAAAGNHHHQHGSEVIHQSVVVTSPQHHQHQHGRVELFCLK